MQTVLENVIETPVPANGAAGAMPRPYEWTVPEYYRMADAGLFEGKRVQLIKGEIVEMAPMGTLHATAIQLILTKLTAIFADSWVVRSQMPLDLGRESEPEPDLAVVDGSVRDYASAHPVTAALVVEVADASLNFDRTVKASLYAEAGIEEYWIVNLRTRVVEVYRVPVNDVELGWSYSERRTFGEGESFAPIARPDASVEVNDILP